MGFKSLIMYGSGTILGAGIFVVIGEVVGEAGLLSPLAYLLAGLVAVTTALSFAEVGARIPTAAGAIDYVQEGFGSRRLGSLAGWLLTIANIVSGATITTGFVSYLQSFAPMPGWLATVGLIAVLGAISIAGMKQSAVFMNVTTTVGVLTLVFILFVSRDALVAAPGRMAEGLGQFDGTAMAGLFAGAFLAIYSFIGFGDMAQTAEEVHDVKTTLPRAIMIAIGIVFFFYLAISAALVGHDDLSQIAQAQAPLVAVVEREGWPGLPVAIASLFVIVNGGLTQIIAAARLILDLGRDGRGMPGFFGYVNPATDTPVRATLVVLALVLALALLIPLKGLASATSLAILIVFAGVNAALWALKRRGQPEAVPDISIGVPILGLVFCLGAIGGQIWLWVGA
ncbi:MULTISPECIES: amino acid permease [unclassified Roseitalea]|uniref:APC family permease n=1 Tax=unclassified Roseitalea TaxID=2639107 RepID=UPI00273F3A94|nr:MULTISPECIES: amino acid permease [unclassified Roseitalea]